jgi:hypothetical protein
VILELYKLLKEIAEKEYREIVEDIEIIFSYSGRARKLRIKLIDATFIDIWHSLEGQYSFHWEQSSRGMIYRHDNAPHNKWNFVKTFPKHCHDGAQDRVIESNLSDKPEQALREFLNIVRKRVIELKHKGD